MHKTTIVLIFFAPILLMGQGKAIPVNISIFNESTVIPFTRLVTVPVHPGIQIGSEINYRANGYTRSFQTINLSYFYHNHLAQGIGLHTELGYEYRLKLGLAFQGLLGVGYMRTYATSEEYTLIDGQYKKKADKGNGRFFPSISADIGFYLRKKDKYGPKIFVRYQSWAEYPYSEDFIPIMTHLNLHLGIKFFINTKSDNHD